MNKNKKMKRIIKNTMFIVIAMIGVISLVFLIVLSAKNINLSNIGLIRKYGLKVIIPSVLLVLSGLGLTFIPYRR